MRRSKFEIIACIVEECLIPRQKTRIMYKSNLSFPQLNAYLDQLASWKLILLEDGKYGATDKGLKFLSIYSQLASMVQIPASPIEETNTLICV